MPSFNTAPADAFGQRFCDPTLAMPSSMHVVAVRAVQHTAGANAHDTVRQP
ncbi:hypothetical protein O4G98_15235 [Zoogloeaceae bacterium G21618-S1]|nr:hypothetical protein [Zoogloeaceae bacterium G21618-S1]